MNPNFFAYGSLPIYAIYFSGLIYNFFTSCQLLIADCKSSFEQAIVISRVYSAFFSTLLIPLLYLIGKNLKGTKTGLLAAFFAAFSVGFIQFAHFGTFEMWLTFFTTLLFWLCLRCIEKLTASNIFLLAIISGILIATKISHILILPLPIIAILYKDFQYYHATFRTKHNDPKNTLSLHMKRFTKAIIRILFFAAVATATYFISNPFVHFDYQSFLNSMKYESGLALGSLPVFYTQGFYDTIPIIFQFNRIFPFILNPLLTAMFVPAFLYLLFQAAKTKSVPLLLLNFYFLTLFLPQAVLFAKWTRYIVPALPFMYLTLSLAFAHLWDLVDRKKQVLRIRYLVFSIFLGLNILFGVSYFITAFARPDTRVIASEFAKLNIPFSSKVMSEPYDLGLIPFNFSDPINMFNFYELDNNSPEFTQQKLKEDLSSTEYMILPSQRLLISRLPKRAKFPNGHLFYSELINSEQWEKIYQTPCDIFCRITYLNDPVFRFEETAMVFDRPTVMIFKKASK
ncbi:MAG TPA: glycosyltransferase family 39 protein [Candidatus Limnocylindrales bacterium]|nr:glycosyltransferase family 39 protein [Candidatus Limnocylindrales bacterium]